MKILVILASGIGNSILFGPALRAIREKDSSWEIHAFAYLPAFASPFIYSDLVDRFIHYEGIATSLALRKEKYDVSICAFPSKRPIYNVLSYIVGAEKRITHSYRSGGVMSMNWLQNARVPADEALHDVEQNLNLLSRLGIEKPTAPQVFFSIPEESNKAAQDFLSGRGLVGRHLVGAHPGAGALSWKRAPISEFLKRIEQERTANSEIVIFGGAEERQEKEELRDALGERAQIFEGSLHDTAALIRRCNAFVTNDTGLMHIASTSSATRVVALFNGTNPRRTRPCTQNSEIVVLKETILKYPFSSMSPKGGGRLSIRRPRI